MHILLVVVHTLVKFPKTAVSKAIEVMLNTHMYTTSVGYVVKGYLPILMLGSLSKNTVCSFNLCE